MCEGTKGRRQKVDTQTKILSPNIRYFVAILRFVAIYALFGNLRAKEVPFGSNKVFFGQEVHYYMVYFAYYTEFNVQICDYAQKGHICRENRKYAHDENFDGHFCFRQRLPTSATLDLKRSHL